MKELLTPSERALKEWAKLHLVKYRRASGSLLVEGFKVVRELLVSDAETLAILCTAEAWEKYGRDLETLNTPQAPCYRLNEKQFAKIAQDVASEGIIAVAREPFMKAGDLSPVMLGERVLLLYQIGEPSNLGAIMRSALWFGFETIVVGAGSVDAGNHKVVKSSMGALFHLRIYEGADLATVITALGDEYVVLAATLDGDETPNILEGKVALLLGGEAHGLPNEIVALAKHRWHIRGTGKIDSLSLPQAAAIMMYVFS